MSLTSPETYVHLIVALLMLALPGVAIVMAIRRYVDKRPESLMKALLPGFALSIAVWPLLLLYFSLVGLSFSPWLSWLLLVLSGAYVAYEAFTARTRAKMVPVSADAVNATLDQRTITHHASRITSRLPFISGLSLLALTLLSLAFRLGDIAGLDVPLFGDSLHHTMITRLIMDTGKVPTGYLPYVPVDTFTYHFGFHTLAADFAMLIGSTAQYAVLLLGQVLNTLSVPLAYMLNRILFESRLAGLGAALLTAVVSIMPAFYVNWGRYTQLSGQLLLMLALVSLVKVMRPAFRWGDFVLLILSVSGLVVVHYRILIFFGLFAIALGAWQLFGQWGMWKQLFRTWGRSIAGMALGLLVALPWIINLIVNYIGGLVRRLGTVTSDYLAVYDNPNSLLIYAGRVMPLVALVGFVAGLVTIVRLRRKVDAKGDQVEAIPESTSTLPPYGACLVLALWVALLVGSLWPVPGAIGSYTVAITLYIPLAALGGYGISSILGLVQRFLRTPRWVFAPLLAIAAPVLAVFLGTAHVADLTNSNYLQKADEQAFAWINSNVEQGARFLISSEFSYLGRGVTATDAGMWLPLLTGHNVSVPALNSWMERPIEPDFFTRTKVLAGYTQPMTETTPGATSLASLVDGNIIPAERSLSNPQTLEAMRGLGITHVYVGARSGHSTPRLDVVEMRKDAQHYRLLYFKDGVYIFQVIY